MHRLAVISPRSAPLGTYLRAVVTALAPLSSEGGRSAAREAWQSWPGAETAS